MLPSDLGYGFSRRWASTIALANATRSSKSRPLISPASCSSCWTPGPEAMPADVSAFLPVSTSRLTFSASASLWRLGTDGDRTPFSKCEIWIDRIPARFPSSACVQPRDCRSSTRAGTLDLCLDWPAPFAVGLFSLFSLDTNFPLWYSLTMPMTDARRMRRLFLAFIRFVSSF